jgi:hypothetical protein
MKIEAGNLQPETTFKLGDKILENKHVFESGRDLDMTRGTGGKRCQRRQNQDSESRRNGLKRKVNATYSSNRALDKY